jgi:hypothetical protein
VGKGGMQQNLDFKYGAGEKKWRVGGYLKKQKNCCEKAVSVGKGYILYNVDDKTKQMYIFVWVRVCAKCYQILFFSSVHEIRVFSLQHMRQNHNGNRCA